MNIPELVDHIHQRHKRTLQKPMNVQADALTVRYSIGSHRYRVTPRLMVIEVLDDHCVETNHSQYEEGILRGGNRDDAGEITSSGCVDCGTMAGEQCQCDTPKFDGDEMLHVPACPHGDDPAECNDCMMESDHAFDAAREDRMFGR